ncbi:MAG: pilus assembly protein PilM [Thermoguttaceae bacterium]
MKLPALLPPPASSIRSVRCAGCGVKNSAQRRYCGKCGNHLWDPCINCGESNSAEEEFCGGCGTNLKAALSKIAERNDKDVAQARFLMKEHRYGEAISLLKPITAAKHSRLAPLARRANDLFEQCLDRQQEMTPRIRKIEEEIKQYILAGDIEQAARKADEIPEAFRSQDLCDLIKESQGNQAEITELSKAVTQLKDGSLTVDLVEKVERLLTLQPDHDEARKQAQAINRGAMRKSKRLALNGDYEKALRILIQVPKVFQDDEFRGFREQIGDLAYLAWDIEHAPLLDKTLFEYARRLHKYLPDDSSLNALYKKLAGRETDFQPLTAAGRRWSQCPRTPVLGAPVEFLMELESVGKGENADTTVLAQNPGRFAIACGLALQGLGLAPIKIDLLPEGSWIDKIGFWLPKRRAQSAWGIEISSSGIKAVKLSIEQKARGNKQFSRERAAAEGWPGSASGIGQPTVLLQECRMVEHRRRLNQSANDKDRDSMLDETLQNFLKQNPLGDEAVILGLPDWMVLLKTVELPPMPAGKRATAIAHEARHLFTTPLPDVVWKHICFDMAEDCESQKRPFMVVYVGVRRMLLKELLTRWHKLGLKIATVQCDMAALYNFAMFCPHPGAVPKIEGSICPHPSPLRAPTEGWSGKERIDPHPGPLPKGEGSVGIDAHYPVALVDLGSDRLNILVCSPRRIWHRSVMFGSDRINKALVREFKLTHNLAEQWKCNPALAPSPGRLSETLQPVYEDYLQETLDSLTAYQQAFPEEKVGRIMGCGGGFLAHDLPRYFLWRR